MAELEGALPGDALVRDADALVAHGRDETEDLCAPPEVVARPRTVADVQAVLRWASRHRVAVTPQGARTGLSGGALPVHGGVALDLRRLDRIRSLDVDDRIAVVEAGVVTADLQRAAAGVGLDYPPDPASRESCTIGGNVAEDSAGPHSCGYGTTRDYVLGLEAVLADGSLLVTGGANRKDVTGYDLTQLLVGSEGTLAVVTAATLRLVTPPPCRVAVGFGFADLEAAARGVLEAFRGPVEPVACELMERRALELVARRRSTPPALVGRGAFLLLDFDGPSEEAVMAAVTAVAERLPGLDPIVARDERDRRRIWAFRAEIGTAVKEHSSYKEVDAVVPRSRLAELVRAARAAAAAADLECVCYGHAGDGNLHVNLLRGDLELDRWQAARDAAEDRLIASVIELGGAVTGEHGVGLTQRRHLEGALPPEALSLMSGLRRLFDPAGILNPGKVLP